MESKEDLDIANAYAAQVYNAIAPRFGVTDTVAPPQPADPNAGSNPNAITPVNPADPNAQPVSPVGPVDPFNPVTPVNPTDPNNPPVQETPIPVLPQEATPPPIMFQPVF